MRRWLLLGSLVFAFAGACGGTEEEKKDDDPVVVPVVDDKGKDKGKDEGDWCCEYEDEEGSKQYVLTDGPAECNEKYEDKDGRWVSGNQCIPCCCKVEREKPDAEGKKRYKYDLTTPKFCAADSGECLVGDAKECQDREDKEEDDEDEKTPRPNPNPQPTTQPRPKTVTPKR